MNKYPYQRSVWIAAIIIIVGLSMGIYFNRSYSYIYSHIDKIGLTSPDRDLNYVLSNNEAASSSLVYVALGDSLTAGTGATDYSESYPYLLAQYFAGNDYRILLYDRAVPGAKTSDLLVSLLPAAIRDNPDVVTLLIGVNDVHGQVSQADFRANYDAILSRLSTETKAKIVIINIPYLGAGNLLLPPYNTLFDFRTREFNKIIAELAAKYQLKEVDLYTQTVALFKEGGSHYAADFFHPSAEGYKIWADLIYADLSN
ncbi:MAG: SGNH/GDSL hydrolase family protein [Patescibacteria group bacterium]